MKSQRSMPPTGSSPTIAISSPTRIDSQPFQKVLAPTEEATARPKNTRAKISGGPKERMAQLAMGAVAIIMITADTVPPRAEHMTAAPTALPACPFRVIG